MDKLKDKYSIKEGEDKIVLSKDSYAVCEFLEELINQLKKGRIV